MSHTYRVFGYTFSLVATRSLLSLLVHIQVTTCHKGVHTPTAHWHYLNHHVRATPSSLMAQVLHKYEDLPQT